MKDNKGTRARDRINQCRVVHKVLHNPEKEAGLRLASDWLNADIPGGYGNLTRKRMICLLDFSLSGVPKKCSSPLKKSQKLFVLLRCIQIKWVFLVKWHVFMEQRNVFWDTQYIQNETPTPSLLS